MENRLNHTRINKEFLIRIYPALPGRRGNNSILSSRIAEEIVGPELWTKNVEKALERGVDKFAFKLRRGLKIELVTK